MTGPSHQPAAVGVNRPLLSLLAGVVALLGAATCSLSMVLAVVAGVGAAAAAGAGSMSGMSGMGGGTAQQPALLALLVQAGPVILIASVIGMSVSVMLRTRPGALPVLIAGSVLYWGMYLQPSGPVMYGAIVAGLGTWAAVIGWTNRQWWRPRQKD